MAAAQCHIRLSPPKSDRHSVITSNLFGVNCIWGFLVNLNETEAGDICKNDQGSKMILGLGSGEEENK